MHYYFNTGMDMMTVDAVALESSLILQTPSVAIAKEKRMQPVVQLAAWPGAHRRRVHRVVPRTRLQIRRGDLLLWLRLALVRSKFFLGPDSFYS